MAERVVLFSSTQTDVKVCSQPIQCDSHMIPGLLLNSQTQTRTTNATSSTQTLETDFQSIPTPTTSPTKQVCVQIKSLGLQHRSVITKSFPWGAMKRCFCHIFIRQSRGKPFAEYPRIPLCYKSFRVTRKILPAQFNFHKLEKVP